MEIAKLVRMANQIGTFFQAMPDHAEALDGIAQHIQKFWEPRMRRELLAALASGHAETAELLPIVREAVEARKGQLA